MFARIGNALPVAGDSVRSRILGEASPESSSICNTRSLSSGKQHLVPYLRMNDISWATEVSDYGYGAARESFEHYACTVIANGREDKNISGSHSLEDLRMAEPATERDSLLYSE